MDDSRVNQSGKGGPFLLSSVTCNILAGCWFAWLHSIHLPPSTSFLTSKAHWVVKRKWATPNTNPCIESYVCRNTVHHSNAIWHSLQLNRGRDDDKAHTNMHCLRGLIACAQGCFNLQAILPKHSVSVSLRIWYGKPYPSLISLYITAVQVWNTTHGCWPRSSSGGQVHDWSMYKERRAINT